MFDPGNYSTYSQSQGDGGTAFSFWPDNMFQPWRRDKWSPVSQVGIFRLGANFTDHNRPDLIQPTLWIFLDPLSIGRRCSPSPVS